MVSLNWRVANCDASDCLDIVEMNEEVVKSITQNFSRFLGGRCDSWGAHKVIMLSEGGFYS
jgi:hypothetical protein